MVELYLGNLVIELSPAGHLSGEHFERAVELAQQLYSLRGLLDRSRDQDYAVYQDFITRVRNAYQAFQPDTLTLDDWTVIMDEILLTTPTWRTGLDEYLGENPYEDIPDWIYLIKEFIRIKFKKD